MVQNHLNIAKVMICIEGFASHLQITKFVMRQIEFEICIDDSASLNIMMRHIEFVVYVDG